MNIDGARKLKILLLEDVDDDAKLVERALRVGGLDFSLQRVAGRGDYVLALRENVPDVIVSDYQLPGFDGRGALRLARELAPGVPVIIVTGAMQDEVAVELLRDGAADYILKDRLARLPPAIGGALAAAEQARQRRQAAQELQASEAKYRALFESSRDAMLTLVGPAWTFSSANPAALRMFGFDNEAELGGLGFQDLSSGAQPEVRPWAGRPWSATAQEMIATALGEGGHFFEWICKRRNGECFDASVLLTRVKFNGDAFLQATVRDISAATQARAALVESQTRFRQLAEHIPQVFFLTDAAHSQMLYVNPAYETTWGKSCESLYAAPSSWLDAVHPEDRGRVTKMAADLPETGQSGFEHEYRVVRPSGEIRWIRECGYPIFNAAGVYIRMAMIATDETARKRSLDLVAGQRDVLAGIIGQQPLPRLLEQIARLYERMHPGGLCSLLLLDGAGQRLQRGAAPSLPESFSQAFHDQEIGSGRGSCAAAAWRRERVVAADIAGHPDWTRHRELALAHGLRASCSTPVFGRSGQLLGTFAVYYRDAREPTPEELETIDGLLAVTAVAIEDAAKSGRLRERDQFFDLSLEVFCIFDPQSERFVQVNPALSEVTGYSLAELTSGRAREFLYPEDRDSTMAALTDLVVGGVDRRGFSNRCLRRGGGYRWLQWTAIRAPDGLIYCAGRDITEQRSLDTQLAYALSHDTLTGLPHHFAIARSLATQLGDGARPLWVLVIGLDHFQFINDSLGHLIGDDLLRRTARRLADALGDAGQLARFEGDQFMAAAGDLDRATALALAERLRAAVALPMDDGALYHVLLTASVGISHSPEHGRTVQELLRRAQAAMTQAKRQGRDCIREFAVEQMLEIEDRLQLGSQLRGAVQRGELELKYQPRVAAGTHALSGFEALLRWNSQAFGPVFPERFIPVAEALGLMPEIGDWVLDEACRQARIWIDCGHRDFSIAVNVAAAQLQRPGLVAQVRAALQRHALSPETLDIELTESALMENVGRIRDMLGELKALGIQLSLDDFGTGYSSLAYLKQFPIDKLKIDQRFVHGLPDDDDDAAIARTIVAMSHQLRMVVSAEGVETQAQADFLKGIGCDELQGYLLGQPVPAEDAERFFRAGFAGSA